MGNAPVALSALYVQANMFITFLQMGLANMAYSRS